MAIFVPAKWTQMIWIIFWFVLFVLFILWNSLMRDPYKPRVPLVLTCLFFLLFMFGFPVSESIYAYNADKDPWNSAPYLQWYTMELRFMSLSVFSLYLTQLAARYFWKPNSAPATAVRYTCLGFFILFAVFAGIVVGDKADEFTNKKPYQVFTFLLDWIWVFVALVGSAIAVRIQSRYSVADQDNDDIPEGMGWNAFAVAILNIYIFLGTLVYAIINVVNRDKYMGTFEYYFHQEDWIEQVAPYFTFIFTLTAYSFFLGVSLLMMRTYNLEEYGEENPRPKSMEMTSRSNRGYDRTSRR